MHFRRGHDEAFVPGAANAKLNSRAMELSMARSGFEYDAGWMGEGLGLVLEWSTIDAPGRLTFTEHSKGAS